MLIKIYTNLTDLNAAGLESFNLPPGKERYPPHMLKHTT